jgi:hypothetical protein
MDFLRGFADAFYRIKDQLYILVPAVIVILIALIFNLIIYALSGQNVFGDFSALLIPSFVFEVIEWALAFATSGLTAFMMVNKRVVKDDLKIFLNLFIFSIFMGFFVTIGFRINVLIGVVIFLFMLYVPIWFVNYRGSEMIDGFGWNLSFIFHGIRAAYALTLLLGTALLTLIPYCGIYLAIFFYVMWSSTTYLYIKEKNL